MVSSPLLNSGRRDTCGLHWTMKLLRVAAAALVALIGHAGAVSTFEPARPPAAPLAVRAPYLNVWLNGQTNGQSSGYLAGQWPRYWTYVYPFQTDLCQIERTLCDTKPL